MFDVMESVNEQRGAAELQSMAINKQPPPPLLPIMDENAGCR
jgi:hypothetical protein